jgi:hypothetical protein
MEDIFKEIRELRNEWVDKELSIEAYNKLKGECRPGCKVEIYWNKDYEGIIDEGYVFVVDGMDADLGDCFIHIPEQDNSGGKDKGEPEWDYMIRLMDNPYCEKIICK